MNTVYKITNLINQKSYIGSSTRVDKRWAQHKNDAFNPNSEKYNYPLYNAFRKYGIENFTFEILKDDFPSIQEMQDYEHDMIVKLHTITPNGYNQTENTNNNTIAHENTQKYIQRVSKKCALVDKNNKIIETYESYHAAARAQGWDGDNCATMIRQICQGKMHDCNGFVFRALDENGLPIIPIPQTRKRRTAVRGISIDNPNDIVYYDSISEAARQEGLVRDSISKCVNGSTRYSHVGRRKWERVGD